MLWGNVPSTAASYLGNPDVLGRGTGGTRALELRDLVRAGTRAEKAGRAFDSALLEPSVGDSSSVAWLEQLRKPTQCGTNGRNGGAPRGVFWREQGWARRGSVHIVDSFQDGGGAGAHVGPARTPGRCPRWGSLYALSPKV